jgi:hypothetical protein
VGSGALGLVGFTTGAVPVAAGVVEVVAGAAGVAGVTGWSGVGVGGAVAAGVVEVVSGAAGAAGAAGVAGVTGVTGWSGVGVGAVVVVWVAAVAAGTAVVGWVGAHVPVAPLIDTVTAVVRPGPATAVGPIADPALPSSAATIMAITVVRRRVRRRAMPFTAWVLQTSAILGSSTVVSQLFP